MRPVPTKVIEGAERIEFPGSEKCVLLIHGYTGSPYEMRYLAENIHGKTGWTVVVPRLPGHATCGEDFSRTGARDWIRASVDEFLDLRSRCDEVYVGGLSMGGILSAILSAVFDVKRTVLYAPAFLVSKQRYKYLTYLMSVFMNRIEKKEEWIEEDPVKERLRREYWRYDWMKQAREFFRVQALGLKMLHRIDPSTLLVIVSKKDMTVPLKVIDVMRKRIKEDFRVSILEESSHVLTVDVEKERVLEETLEWFKG